MCDMMSCAAPFALNSNLTDKDRICSDLMKLGRAGEVTYYAVLVLAVLAVLGRFDSANAQASKNEDDYVACLIGQAAVALHKQGPKKDAKAAQTKAYNVCNLVGQLSDDFIEGIGDYVNMMVQKMAE
jgi:hypothetical protein